MKGGGQTGTQKEQTKDKNVYENPIHRSCRVCQYFIRVNEGKFVTRHRGFCSMGQNDGDFDMYLSSSYARECPSFIFSLKKAEISAKEEQLEDAREEMFWDYEKKHDTMKEFMKGKLGWREYVALKGSWYPEFVEKHMIEYEEIDKLAEIQKKDYINFFDMIRMLSVNKFAEIPPPAKASDSLTVT